MEKKSSIHDIHKVIQKDNIELYKVLNSKLGDMNPFAKFSIGGGFYVWTDNKLDWKIMTQCTESKQHTIRQAIINTKKEIALKLGDKTTDLLFTYPDESYVYYYEDGSSIKILITGWGFKKPTRVTGNSDISNFKLNKSITISFINDGIIQKDFEFGIQLPKQIKKLRTDNEGNYLFSEMRINNSYTFIDLNTDKKFNLTINEEQDHYTFDITTYCQIKIRARLGDNPLTHEDVNISYNGKSYILTTDSLGATSINLPFIPNDSVSASMRELSKTEIINQFGNLMEFYFEEPKIETNVDVIVNINNKPAANQSVMIEYGGNLYSGKTDEYGKFSYRLIFIPEETCNVSIPDFDNQSKVLTDTNNNSFIFEKNVEDILRNKIFAPYILVKDNSENICSNYNITVKYKGNISEYISDENGIIQLPECEEGEIIEVKDSINPDNTCEYHLDSNIIEYIFYINKKSEKIRITVLDSKGQPINCHNICFKQEDAISEINTTLDNNGSTLINYDDFTIGKDITAYISSPEKNIDPITFTLEEDEFEYILQEEVEKSSWAIILMQIFIFIIIAAALIIAWPYIKDLFSFLSKLIYN